MILYIGILLFICVLFCGAGMWVVEDKTMPLLMMCGVCGIGCILCIGLYFGGMQ